jgi:hypothetical protein
VNELCWRPGEKLLYYDSISMAFQCLRMQNCRIMNDGLERMWEKMCTV